jgi:hypothetical protein
MILRRLSEHLKAQNWTAVTLEFVIVMTGVVIGFQVTAWNAARQDRDLERSYYRQLIVDLEADTATARRGLAAADAGAAVLMDKLRAVLEGDGPRD